MTLRVFVEPSDYILRNAGDTAMLRVGVTRLAGLWPSARVQVLSDVPDAFPQWAPNVSAVDAGGRHTWLRTPFLVRHLPATSPEFLRRSVERLQSRLRQEKPAAARRLLEWSRHQRGESWAEIAAFLRTVEEADLVVATGMGGITDVFPDYARELLDVLDLAQSWGASTALFGQGLGPLDDAALRARARRVLGRADLIALRERRASVPLLRSLGVSEERVMTTGDDAIELAAAARPLGLGQALGINVRDASYANVDADAVERIGSALGLLEKALTAPVVPIPISSVPGEEDATTISRILGTGAVDERPDIDALFARVARCRVVIAGSYHAAVFSLSMGIPAIGLHASPYYRDKFLGLQDMFGEGCWPVSLDAPGFEERLVEAAREAWSTADELRPALLEAADRQIVTSRAAYDRIRQVVEARMGGARTPPTG